MPDYKEIKTIDPVIARTDVVTELKHDGTCMEWDGQHLVSERGIIRDDRFPHIVKELQGFNWKLQGEIAVPGGNVHDINASINWQKGLFYAFQINELNNDDWTDALPVDVRAKLDELFDISANSFKALRTVKRFPTVKAGWKFIQHHYKLDHYVEGLVIKPHDGSKGIKFKILREGKFPVLDHEPGKDTGSGPAKGAFIIDCLNGNRGKCSALSVGYVDRFHKMVKAGKTPYAEIEYPFMTSNGTGVLFQPRLRDLDTLAELKKKFPEKKVV
ncbi:hypothetical protein CMI47_11295 [Candidatus Pacearchaeota archaeon]|nr:hypothetical protein [Candidatus Pacearchaeota archaeon]|tara:strand:- start:2617 stop:3432 length:816 start_codon:yes stop_codon:yes gene_type:complete